MRGLSVFLFFAMVVAAIFAFSGAFTQYPVYYNQVTVAPYQFANFLFWMFLLLLFVSLIAGGTRRRQLPMSPAEREVGTGPEPYEYREGENAVVGGFTLALFLLIIAIISGLFGFGVIGSTLAGLAMIVFWIAVVVGIVALAVGLFEHGTRPR